MIHRGSLFVSRELNERNHYCIVTSVTDTRYYVQACHFIPYITAAEVASFLEEYKDREAQGYIERSTGRLFAKAISGSAGDRFGSTQRYYVRLINP